ncbi:MAG: hypothetical protein K0S32_4232, partial [Bacteroidetes bacterium]|nr:hypothetical protein [Bacteroidota bacterium]
MEEKKPVASDYGFTPEPGWKLSQCYFDYESGLLIVSVSIIDESKWIDTGFGSRTIPTKEFKIDPKTKKVLSFEEWSRYFNYEKVETFSEDGKFKLITQRVYDPERNSDSIKEELIYVPTGVSSGTGSGIAFYESKRENMLESHYRRMKEKEEYKAKEAAKPDLNLYSLNKLNELQNGAILLVYSDRSSVFKLVFDKRSFHLLKSTGMPVNYDWRSLNYNQTDIYSDLNEFWQKFSSDKKWFITFDHYGGAEIHSKVFTEYFIRYFNELRKNHDFTLIEYEHIQQWENMVWTDEIRRTEYKQYCPVCSNEVGYNPRYPKHLCSECRKGEFRDESGALVTFSNTGIGGGFMITYLDEKGNTIREDVSQFKCNCVVNGIKC